MINNIQIKNYKSIVDLDISLGTFNVFIGENGCGKSNILEAIALASAASSDKLDYEFFENRGIRATSPEFMTSAFGTKRKKEIILNIGTPSRIYRYRLVSDSGNPKKWVNKNKDIALKEIQRIFNAIYLESDDAKRKKVLEEIKDGREEILKVSDFLAPYRSESTFKEIFTHFYPKILEDTFTYSKLSEFIIYSPEQSFLRKPDSTAPIYPMGNKGQGLFQHIKELAANKKNIKILNKIKRNLSIIDWYDDFKLPESMLSNEFSIHIQDKYLENLKYFDERSANEGFLFLLFYSVLFESKASPSFFAIDNLDTSLNPKLCQRLTQTLTRRCAENNKQVIITTQNPAILDGLNLKDDSQRLFVISRDGSGHTRADRIEFNEKRTMRLSEVWTKGFIGGLPENF